MAEVALELRAILESAERAASDQDFASAEQHLRLAVVLQEATLGPGHPELANSLNNLGIVCERLGKTADAEACYRRAYAIVRSTLAADDPLRATSEQNLREFCLATGRPFETPSAQPSMAPGKLPPRHPIEDFDPPPAPVVPSVAPARRPGTSATPEVTTTSPAQLPPSPPPDPAPQRSDTSAARTPATTSPVPSPLVARPVASAQRDAGSATSAASTPQAASSRRNVTWIVVGSAIVLMLVLVLAGGLSRSDDSAERAPAPPVDVPAETPDPRTGASPPPAASPPAGRTVPRSDAPGPAATTAVSVVDAKLCRTLSTTDWQCTPVTNPAQPGAFLFYTRIKAARDTTVRHRWYLNGNLRRSVDLRITANPGAGYRTYSRAPVAAERRGNWTIEVRDADGALLHEERFAIP